jgi:hypothetical protein
MMDVNRPQTGRRLTTGQQPAFSDTCRERGQRPGEKLPTID